MTLTDNLRNSGIRPSLLARILESPVYALAVGAYSCGAGVASLFNSKASLLSKGHGEVWERLRDGLEPGARYVWVHAASLGEFEQGRPVIERIRANNPEYRIILTFFSPSGYEVRKNYRGADLVVYLPFDLPWNARRFVDMVRPEKAVFIKYEIWRNYLKELVKRDIPVYLVSAVFRKEQAFFKGYGSFYRRWLHCFTHIFVQDTASRELLAGIGVGNVTVTGDTRFDRVIDVAAAARKIPSLERFAGRRGTTDHCGFVFVAGSSWPKDEEVYAPWLASKEDVKAIIAPHEFDASRLSAMKRMFGDGTVLLSEADANPSLLDKARVVITDCFGLLSSAYAYGDMAYVGGGFGVGIHNLNEAAVYGIPVLFGPNHERFNEAIDLKTLGGGIAVESSDSFRRNADRLLYDTVERERRGRWAAEYIKENCGAADTVYDCIFR